MPLPILIAAALAQTAAAPALTPEAADARCVVILGFIAKQPNQPAARLEAVKTGTAYYLGKLRGRRPGINLVDTLNTAANRAQTEKADVVKESQRCGGELSALAAATGPAASPRKP
ncbi:hypothetical protein GCM10011380_12330 [Sphingomonas metalli]|uniref:Uncharacterized protein n=1 Tax=Sphingomonas metalli TaxID=1779358 RepID=A0A916SZF1_9SPHN|nr:hypothetical protein [Sphingomonas metalli]GGB24319.1 hypothetical protein GCM10011380_12330 [Sphingomonas metalli]